MRLSTQEIQSIKSIVHELAGDNVIVKLFGSRLDDNAKGGDLDLLVISPHDVSNAALLIATIGAKISRSLSGRKTDVLLIAPNLQQHDIHIIANQQGVEL